MVATVGTAFSAQDSSTTSTTLSVPGAPSVPIGDALIVASAKVTAGGSANGLANITEDTNTPTLNVSHACRASTIDVCLSIVPITDTVEASDSPLLTFNSNGNRRLGSIVPVNGLLSNTPDSASSFTLGDGGTSTGSNGSSTTPTGTITTVASDTVVFALVGFGGTATAVSVEPSGWTKLDQVATAAGSSDRNFAWYYRVYSGAGAKTFNGMTLGTTTGWAVALVAFSVAAGGSTFDVNLSETVNFVDEPSEQFIDITQILSESIGFSDTVVVDLIKVVEIVLSESIGFADTSLTSLTAESSTFTGSVADVLDQFLAQQGYVTGTLTDRQFALLKDAAAEVTSLKSSADLQLYLYNKVRDFLRLNDQL